MTDFHWFERMEQEIGQRPLRRDPLEDQDFMENARAFESLLYERDDDTEFRMTDRTNRGLENSRLGGYSRDSWLRLPDALISALCTTMPQSGLKIALTEKLPKFTSALIMRYHRVLDDKLIALINGAFPGVEQASTAPLSQAFMLFSRWGPSLEKITLRNYNSSWTVVGLAIVCSYQLRRVEIYGPKQCSYTLCTLAWLEKAFEGASRMELKIGDQVDKWHIIDVTDLARIFLRMAPYLRSLSLGYILPIPLVDVVGLQTVRSLDVNIKSANDERNLQLVYLPHLTFPRLTTFSLTYPFRIPADGLATGPFVVLPMEQMAKLRKVALALDLVEYRDRKDDGYEDQQKTLFAEQAIKMKEALKNLQVVRLAVHADYNTTEWANFDYRSWVGYFEYNAPSIRKLILEAPVSWSFPRKASYLELDFTLYENSFCRLESLLINYRRCQSISEEKLFNDTIAPYSPEGDDFLSPLDPSQHNFSSTVKVLTLLDIPKLSANIFDNIKTVFHILVEINISARDPVCYQPGGFLHRVIASVANFVRKSITGTDEPDDQFDLAMAAFIRNRPTLRVVRFLDDFNKVTKHTITAMCERAKELEKYSSSKKMLLRVPLTAANRLRLEEKNPEVLQKMKELHRTIEFY